MNAPKPTLKKATRTRRTTPARGRVRRLADPEIDVLLSCSLELGVDLGLTEAEDDDPFADELGEGGHVIVGPNGGEHDRDDADRVADLGSVSPSIVNLLSQEDPIPSGRLYRDYLRHWCGGVCPESRACRYLREVGLADGKVSEIEPVGFLELGIVGLSRICGGVAETSGVLVASAVQLRLLELGERTVVRLER